MALVTISAKGSKPGAAQQAYEEDVYKPKQEYTVSGRPVTQAAQEALGPASNGQTYSSYNYGNNVTTKKVNSDGTLAGVDTRPFEKTVTYGANGEVITRESPLATTIQKPVTKETTVTTKDGRTYTFEGDNWLTYAAENGLDPNNIATALSYPSYVDANEANRFLNEQYAIYGIDPKNPNPNNGLVYTQQQGAGVIPGYSTSATGGTNTAQGVLGYMPGAYKSFDAEGWFNQAKESNRDSVEAQRDQANAAFDYNIANTNETFDKNAQNAYILSTISNKKAADQMRESGIKSGMTETSLLRGQLNFENAYNENEANRAAAIREIEAQRAQMNAELDAQRAAYEADAAISYAQMAQQENAAANQYAFDSYWRGQEQANIDREWAYQLEQDKKEEEAARVAPGYDPGVEEEDEDEYVKNPVAVVRNGDGDEIQVMYVDGRAYNVSAVQTMLKNGTAYMTNDGTVKMVRRAN